MTLTGTCESEGAFKTADSDNSKTIGNSKTNNLTSTTATAFLTLSRDK